MADIAPEWLALVDELEPHVSPRWAKQAREHGAKGWIRLIAMVDAHNQLANPTIDEKIAMTMVDLAQGREAEQAGWAEIQERSRVARLEIVSRVVDSASAVLPDDLVPLFIRSVDPTIVQM
jgi:hypothetical protein